MIIDDARFGPIGKTTKRSQDVTVAVRKLIKNGKIDWKKNHAHKYLVDSQNNVAKEVIVWYRLCDRDISRKSKPILEPTNYRTIHILISLGSVKARE